MATMLIIIMMILMQVPHLIYIFVSFYNLFTSCLLFYLQPSSVCVRSYVRDAFSFDQQLEIGVFFKWENLCITILSCLLKSFVSLKCYPQKAFCVFVTLHITFRDSENPLLITIFWKIGDFQHDKLQKLFLIDLNYSMKIIWYSDVYNAIERCKMCRHFWSKLHWILKLHYGIWILDNNFLDSF